LQIGQGTAQALLFTRLAAPRGERDNDGVGHAKLLTHR
jgi:hypothetical protein